MAGWATQKGLINSAVQPGSSMYLKPCSCRPVLLVLLSTLLNIKWNNATTEFHRKNTQKSTINLFLIAHPNEEEQCLHFTYTQVLHICD